MAVLSIGQMWAAEDEVHKFNSSNETREVGLNNDAAIPAIEIAAPAYPVKKVAVNCKYNKSGLPGVTISVTVGGEAFGESYTFDEKTTKTVNFEGSAASGDIVISFVNNSGTGTGKGTFYVYYVELTEGASGGTPTCATPTFDPAAGTFYGSQEIAIATGTAGASIYYTTDGTTPSSTNGTLYEDPFDITATTTIKAIAVKEGANDSEIASATFTKGEAVTSYAINFETNNLDAYVNWNFVNIGIKSTTITAHGGTYYGANINGSGNGVATASITTKAKYANPGTLTFYISKESNNTTASSWKAQVSEDGEEWTDVETFDAKGMDKGVWNECTADLSSYSNVYVRISYGSSSAIRAIDDIELAAASAAPKAAKPTFESGDDFVTSTIVTLACATEGAKIYYTTNGDAPTSASTLYEGAIPVSTTTTIRAIAIADGYDNSAVAEKTFNKIEAKETLAALLEATTSTETAFNVVITDWVVTGVQGTRAWIADAANEKGILLYKSGHNFEAGNKLNGVVIGTKTKLYQGYPELTTLVSTDVTVTTAAAVTPRTTTIAALTSGHPAEQGTVVKLENLTYTAASTSLSDGENTIQTDNKFYSASLIDGATYNLTGVVEYLDGSVVKIMPRSADDVEQVSGGGLPEVTGLAALKAEAVGTSYLLTLTDAIVTLVDGNNAFIEDATAGALIYFSNHGLAAGDKLNGQYEVTTATYNGKFEITAMTAQDGAETTHNAEIPVTTLTIAQLNANFAANESRRIKIVGANVTDAIGSGDRNGEISDGANIILYAGKSGVTAALNDNIDVIGYPTFYITNTADQQQLAVWAQADITVNEKEDPELAYNPTEVNVLLSDLASFTPAALEYATGFDGVAAITYESSDPSIATVETDGTVTLVATEEGSTTITATFAGNSTYKADNASYTITVSATAPVIDTRKIAESPEGGFVDMISGDLSGNEISFAAYQGGAANAPNGNNTAHELRLYKYQATTEYGGYITITAKDGCTIDQVVITVGGNCNVGWCKDAEALPTKEDTPIAISTSSAFDTGTGLDASSVSVVNIDESNQFKIKTITVYYNGDGIDLESIAISGTASVMEYNDGDEFNPAGLVVTGHYSDDSYAVISTGITWAFDPATLSAGDESVSVTATVGEITSEAVVVDGLTVSSTAPVLTDYYEKAASIVEGTYLIVYEDESVAFNGGLETLDAKNNYIEVVITSENKIAVTSATEAATVYIDPTAGTIQAANGKYIGVTSNSNGLKQSDNADAYENAFAVDGEGNAVISAVFENANMTMRYNKASDQKRFRYFGSSQQPIALYKLANEVIKPAAGLAWDPAEDITLTVGDEFTAPTLLNPNNIDAAEIIIASSNPNVATVTAGVVELVAEATGTTTITATFAGNASYKPATVSYKIKVNPAHSIYVSPSLTVNFGSVAKDATVDDKVITVTLTGVDAATATLGGTNPEVFGFTPAALTASGNITISASSATVGEFEAKLTISDDAGLATSRVVTIKLTVTDPAAEETPISTSTQWVAATAADLVDGAEVIITGVKDEVVYAMGEQKSTNRAAYAAEVDGEGVLTPGEGTMSFTLVAQETEGVFALRTSDGKYLYAAASGSNHMKTQAEVDVNAQWTLTVASAVATGSSNRNVMQFNGSGQNMLFSCYATASQSAIQLYVPKPVTPEPQYETVRGSLTAGNYYTVCYNKTMTAIKGASLWSFCGKDASMAYIEQAAAPYEAGTPYLIYAESDKLEALTEEVSDPAAGSNNGLYGTFDYLSSADLDDKGATHMLKNNELRPLGNNNHLDAYRAYVILNDIQGGEPAPAPGRRVRAIPMQTNAATGFENIETSEKPMKLMINGQMYILRGEKMYDATGRLVK